jgi:hypothetical protein
MQHGNGRWEKKKSETKYRQFLFFLIPFAGSDLRLTQLNTHHSQNPAQHNPI